ncbi:MAG TPA: universal stress protein [Archaeoglobus profundus]|nr:universal stress protein [Archaeoglobus profundus]
MLNMLRRILFTTDFSEYNLKMLEYLPEFKKLGTEEIVIVRVINLNRIIGAAGGINLDEYIEVHQREANEKMKEIAEKIENMGLKPIPILPCPAGDPVSEILKSAKEYNVDLILTGARGRSIKKILLGSVSEGVVKNTDRPVMVFKYGVEKNVFKRLLYAHDFSRYAEKAIDYIKFIANKVNSDIILVHVIEKKEIFEKSKIEEIESKLKDFNVKTVIGYGTPHKEILRIAKEENATSIFLGSKGIGSIFGSTTDAIVRYSNIPVFVSV